MGKEGVPMSVLMDDRYRYIDIYSYIFAPIIYTHSRTQTHRRPARDERYFAYVHDGDCINKTGALPPALKVHLPPPPPLRA